MTQCDGWCNILDSLYYLQISGDKKKLTWAIKWEINEQLQFKLLKCFAYYIFIFRNSLKLTSTKSLYQGRRNVVQSRGAMEYWKVLLATMVGRQEKFLNSRRCRMAITVTFWPWWQSFNNFYFQTLFFFLCFPFFFLLRKKKGGKMGGAYPPPPPGAVHVLAIKMTVFRIWFKPGLLIFVVLSNNMQFWIWYKKVDVLTSPHLT